MKKRIWIAVLIGLILCLNAMAAENGSAPADMCLIGEDMFAFAQKDTLVIRAGEQTIHRAQCEGVRYVNQLDGVIYALCEKNDSACVRAYDEELNEIGRYDVGWLGQIDAFAANGTHLCFIVMNGATYSSELYLYDMQTGEMECKEDFSWVMSLAADDERIAFQCFDGFQDAIALHIPPEAVTGVAFEQPEFGELLLVPDMDACVIIGEDDIHYITWDEGKNVKKSYSVPGIGQLGALADADENGVYVYDDAQDEMLFYSYEMLAQTDNRTLTIASYVINAESEYMKDSVRFFRGIHPEYTIEFRAFGELDKMRLELMSGKSDIDLIVAYDSVYADIAASGVFADLRSFAPIREAEENNELLDWMFHVLETENGELYAMPRNDPRAWSLNESEFARLGLALPQDGWTWDDLLSLARQAKQIDDTIYTVDMDAMNYLLEQALRSCVDIYTGKVDLDTPHFRHALEIYKALYEEGHVMWALSDEPVLCTAQTPLQTGASGQKIRYIRQPLLAEGESPFAYCSGTVMGVYTAGDDMDMAAEFMANYYLFPTMGGVVSDSYMPLYYTDAERYIRFDCTDTEHVENLIGLCDRVETGMYSIFTGGPKEIYSDVLAYAEGRIDQDRAVETIQKKLNMYINE